MILYVLKPIKQLTHRYHSSGGLVVVAENIERAKELVSKEEVGTTWDDNSEEIKAYPRVTEEEWNNAIAYPLNSIMGVNGQFEEKVYIFPNAGCC